MREYKCLRRGDEQAHNVGPRETVKKEHTWYLILTQKTNSFDTRGCNEKKRILQNGIQSRWKIDGMPEADTRELLAAHDKEAVLDISPDIADDTLNSSCCVVPVEEGADRRSAAVHTGSAVCPDW